MNSTLYEVIKRLVSFGIDIDIRRDIAGDMYYDLSTGMKSHAHMFIVDDSKLLIKMRYDNRVTIDITDNDIDSIIIEIATTISNCGHGRDYGYPGWFKLFDELDIKFC